MDLSIVILSYKMKGLVKNCLKTIFESNFDFEYEIILVDNASKDKIDEELKESFAEVKLIMASKNAGFGTGVNLGLKEAKGKYVLILNPDIHILPGSVETMISYLKQNQNVGLIAPKLLNPDRSLQYTCYKWHNFWTPIYRRTFLGKLPWAKKDLDQFLMIDWDHNDTREVDWVQGSCMLIPKSVLDKVGFFDERFFMYFEDTDLCRRINQAKFKIVYCASAQMIHFHRRQSADGGLFSVFINKLTRTHIISWLKYMVKWRKEKSGKNIV